MTDIEISNIHYSKDDPYNDPFVWGMLAEWHAPSQGLGGIVFREGKREDFERKSFVRVVREVAEKYVSKYAESPDQSVFAQIGPDHKGAIDSLGEVQSYMYKGIKGIRAFVGKEDYNVYFWPRHLITSTDKGR